MDSEVREVVHTHQNGEIRFSIYTPNWVCAYRWRSFSEKEPETLEWINKYGGNGAFYDIGANIGVYSLYYAKRHNGKVFSFEPSVFNLRQLAKNISFNSLTDRVTIITNPLSDKSGEATFTNGNVDEGGAFNAFGVDHGHDGKPILSDIRYKVLGFTLDSLFESGAISEEPALIKIDVDGIEHLILSGAINVLSLKSCRSVLVEVNEDFEEQSSNVSNILSSMGYFLQGKPCSEIKSKSSNHYHTYNQIWVKK